MNFERQYTEPEISFSEWVKQQGIDPTTLARDNDYAEVIGGAFTASTKAAQGKLKAPAERIETTERLHAVYNKRVASGEIKSITKSQPLNWDSEQDRAYVRTQIKRAETPDIKNAWQSFYDSHFQIPAASQEQSRVLKTVKPSTPFYDLEKLQSIPIAEVAQAYGVELKQVGSDYWCKLRDEKTASCKLYTKTNSFCDFGNANYGGDTIELTRFLHSCSSRYDAMQILANTFGIVDENQQGYMPNRFPSNRQLAKIGIQGNRATKNFDFHIERYGLEAAKQLSDKYAMTVEELSHKYPEVYHQMLRARAVPYVRDLRQLYFTELRNLYDWSVMLNTDFQTDSKLFDTARELMHDAQTGEHILHSAIRDFKKVPFRENHYDLVKDYTAITNGNMSVELINDESIGYRDLKSLLRAENHPMGYTNLPKAQFDTLVKQLPEITSYAAFAKGQTVTLAYDAAYTEQINDLINFNQGEQMAAAQALEVQMLPTM